MTWPLKVLLTLLLLLAFSLVFGNMAKGHRRAEMAADIICTFSFFGIPVWLLVMIWL